MNHQQKVNVSVWFWVVAVLALLWNIMGCGVFLTEIFAQETAIETMTDAQKEWVRSTPRWIYVVFGVSVVTGVLASIFLLMRRKLAVPLFAISLASILTQMIYTMLVAGGLQVLGPSGAVMPALVLVLAIVWLFFALSAKGKAFLV